MKAAMLKEESNINNDNTKPKSVSVFSVNMCPQQKQEHLPANTINYVVFWPLIRAGRSGQKRRHI